MAGLANLTLTDAEITRLQADLDGILEHMDRLNEADTSGVEPMSQVLFDAGGIGTTRAGVASSSRSKNRSSTPEAVRE